ncbi:MAG: ParB/RepB/Spo0J family partition protein [Deltaproteobacteria bacterium]
MKTTIQEIPLSEFDLTLSEMRIMNRSRVLQIEKSMSVHGQLQAVVARVHTGGIQLIDGFKRLYAADDLMMETLQCQLLEIDLVQAKVLLLSYNRPHQSMEVLEEALVLKDLLETHKMDQRRLARLVGYSRSWVSRRLGLVDKITEEVSAEIRMGTLTSSHARALMKLPRGNQAAVAQVMTSFRLTSRQSETLTEAYLQAKDENQQRYILAYPEKVLVCTPEDPEEPEGIYDAQLSEYGNDLMLNIVDAHVGLEHLLSRLEDERIGMLTESEKVIITPFLQKTVGCARQLTAKITHL